MIGFVTTNQLQNLIKFIQLFGRNYLENFDDDQIHAFLYSQFNPVLYIEDTNILHPSEILNYMNKIGSRRLFFLHESCFDTEDKASAFFVEHNTKNIEVEQFLEKEFVEKSSDSDSYYPIYIYVGKGIFVDTELSLFIHVSTFHEAAYFFSPDKETIESLAQNLDNSGIEYSYLDHNTQ